MPKTDISIQELVNKVDRRELLLPEMQRRFVWTATRVRDLLDSLYRGYPTGNILVWETDEEVISKDLSIEARREPTVASRLLLLDGQQRITSLAAVLTGQKVRVRNRKREIEILFNLDHPEGPPEEATEVDENGTKEELEDYDNDEEDEEIGIQYEMRKKIFVVGSRALKNDPIWVSVSDIFKKSDKEILKPLGINSDDNKWDEYSARLNKVRKIADYQYVMQVLEKDKSYQEVTEIFVRVNSLGIKLRGSDLALAQITSKWKGFIDEIEKFSKRFKDDEDYIIETGLAVRMLTIFATKQCRFKTIGKIKADKLKESWEKAKKALIFIVDFMRNNGEIDKLNYLSSPFLLIPIGIFAAQNDEKLSNEDEKQLLKWFFIAHMRGHYSLGSSETILDSDLALVFAKNKPSALLTQLQNQVKKFAVDYDDIAGKGIRSPMFSMLYLILKHNNAKDWFSGMRLAERHIGKSQAIQFHHIFPKSLLQAAKYERKEINEIANIAFLAGKTNRHILNKEPKIYFARDIIPNRGIEALELQLVPSDKELWEINNYRKYIDYRRNAIANAINNFLAKFEI